MKTSDRALWGEFYRHGDPSFDRDDDPEFEVESYRHTFRDGSVIELHEYDHAVFHPHRKTTRLWTAEEVSNLIDLNEWSNEEVINYIKTNHNED